MKLSDLTGTKYSIIQGGMANIATGEFAAACSNAGALGLVASGGMNAEQLREQIRICKSKTDKPFGVNLMLMNPDVDNIAKMLVEEKVQFITTGAGNPGKYMKAWKEMGAKVFPVVASVALAKIMVRAGADAVIAEGGESGGHVGDMTTMTLLPQIVAAVDVPVIAAGGIASGKQVAAAYILGACGVQIGTCLLVSEECPIHENYKQTLIKAKDNATTVTGRSQGAPVRIIKNEMAREYLRLEAEGADRERLEQITLGGLRRAVSEGDMIRGSVMSGQVCGQLTEIRPVAQIVSELDKDARQVLQQAANLDY
ncbi:MAG: nitronate monooxygenase [Pseudobutyrivibrio sp.]|nr:nitronate monooxygenase [Pseudobutyrivibrio sp.]